MENQVISSVSREESDKNFMNNIHKWGRVWGIVLFVMIVGFPIVVSILYAAVPQWEALLKGIIAILPLYWAIGLIEMFTYIPMLGAGGTYLSFVTGNIANLKLPCALDAMEKANVKPSSQEGEIISTLSIAVSSITTTIIVAIGVLLIVPLSPILQSEALTVCFANILPALFGGLAIAFVSKNIKLSIPPIILMIILFVFIPALNASTVGIMVPVGVVFTIVLARVLYKKGKI